MLTSRTALILGVVIFGASTFASALVPDKKKISHGTHPKVVFAAVAPIFKNCAMCHSGAKPKHGLDLSSYAKIMKGDHEGKVVIPGNPAGSRLSKAIHHAKGATAMPPGGKLPAGDVAKIDAWIKAGAKEK